MANYYLKVTVLPPALKDTSPTEISAKNAKSPVRPARILKLVPLVSITLPWWELSALMGVLMAKVSRARPVLPVPDLTVVNATHSLLIGASNVRMASPYSTKIATPLVLLASTTSITLANPA